MKNLNDVELQELLASKHACSQAIEWTKGKTLQEAWKTCERGDWMLWLSGKFKLHTLQQVTMAKVKCARLVEHLMKDGRSINALNVAEQFALGDATLEEMATAYAAAYAAYAADAAAYAAAAAAADTADTDAAAYAAAAAAAADTDAAARKDTLKKCADICREYLPMDFEEGV